MNALQAAKQAIADHDILYTGHELRPILANLVDYTESLIERPKVMVTSNLAVPGFHLPYSYYEHTL